MADLGIATNPNKALWEKGDFTRIADAMRQSGQELVDSLPLQPGMDVLDLGCGDGTTALPAAARGATVLGVDIAANLVAAGNGRARTAGLDNLKFEEGDASNLGGLADNAFDLLISIFGAMFAPRPLGVAREMVRVTKPGGLSWATGFPAIRRLLPDPEDQRGLHSATTGGLRQPHDLGRRRAGP